MPQPRKALISLETTPYYHCVSRCVRRAFLCGKDPLSGTSYEHRRQWIEDQLLHLAAIFTIDLAAYAVMSNHYHVVLYVDREQAVALSPRDVVQRWHRLFKGCELSQRFIKRERLGAAELLVMNSLIDQWRERLSSISWFMRVMNEGIARASNKEDSCTGRFWEGRFKCQALLDEKALIACAAYVDLNPIRAKMAATPKTSRHTSIKKRIEQAHSATQPNHLHQQAKQLLPFSGNPRADQPKGLPFRLTDYLELVDWTGRIIREDKRGSIDGSLPPILQRLNIDPAQWLLLSTRFESRFKSLVGTGIQVRAACQQLGRHWAQGMRACEMAFPTQ